MIELEQHTLTQYQLIHRDGFDQFKVFCIHWVKNKVVSFLLEDCNGSIPKLYYRGCISETKISQANRVCYTLEHYCHEASKSGGVVYGFMSYREFGEWLEKTL